MNTERNLLAGILALQLNFIDRRQLLGAFDRWVSDKSKALTRILESLGHLTTERRALLDALVEEHLKLHGGDPQKSLAQLTPVGPLRDELAALADRDLEASLAHLPASRGSDAPGIGVQEPFRQVRTRDPASPGDDDRFRGAPNSAIESTTDLPRFRVLRPHARGGLGEVYVARDEELHRDVALKEIQARHAANPASRQRFVLEAQITGGLEHPGIVPVYGLGTYADGRPYYAMRFIKGDNLRAAIEKFHAVRQQGTGDREEGADDTALPSNPGSVRRPADNRQSFASLEFRKLLGRFIDVCNAIEYAHSRGVLHRDLKPGNIMLGKYGETLVVDWGLAKVVGRAEVGDLTAETTFETTLRPPSAGDSAPTEMGSIVGTPHYMSPEQAEGRLDALGPASDVYSLGATLYTVLTGQPAFTGAELEVLRSVAKGEFSAPRRINRCVPRSLEAVCLKAMALNAAERYPSARALADDVEHWLADEPVTALRETAGERLGRWGRKHRSWVRAGVAAALVVAAVSGAALVVVDRARRAEAAQRQVAVAREAQAIDAVKRFRDAVANEPELKNSPQLERLRKRLLKEPLAFFKELRERLQADNDSRPESLARLAQACFDLGVLTDGIGDKQDALAAHRECVAIRRKLADDNPSVTQFQSNLRSHNNIGVLLSKTGKPAEALAAYQSALAIRQKLADDNPTVTEYQSDLAGSHNNIGNLLRETRKPAEALAAYQSALAIRQRLAEDNPTVTEYQSDLASSHNNVGVLLIETGNPAEALAAFQSALAIQQKLADDNPTVTEYQSELARSHNNIGNLLRETGKPAEALAAYQSALAIRRKLADENPSVTQYQSDLAVSHNNVGVLFRQTGKPAEALAAYQSALAIQQKLAEDNPTVTEYQSELALSHNNIGILLRETGKSAEALAAFGSALAIRQKLADENPSVAQFLSDLAASHNSIGLLLSHTGKAAEALAAYQSALAIWQKLADDNPSVIQFRSDLAASQNKIGLLLSHTGKAAEALTAYQSALAIKQRVADDNPTVTQFQSDLALSHNNIGVLLSETGKPAEALAAYQSALAIQQKLAEDNPTVTEYQSDLAASHKNIGVLLRGTGKPAEALAASRSALDTRQKLAAANPSVTEFQRDLASSHNIVGVLLIETGNPAEALAAYESALAIRQKLADDNTTVTQYQSDLGASHHNIGNLLSDTGKPAEALAAYQSALAIRQRLAREYPESPDYASDLGGTLATLARLDLNAKQFEEARVRLREAVDWERKALAANSANPVYRRFLTNNLTNLIVAARALGDTDGVAEAERELAELRASDPEFADLDARLAEIAKGEQRPASEAERLALAQRAYDKALFAMAARLWVEALDANPALADDRQTQHRYNAACCAALAGAVPGRDVPQPDEAGKASFRKQALGWLKAELAAWTALLTTADGPQRAQVARTLEHWQGDLDLAGIRDPNALAKLPDDERAALAELWTEVAALRKEAETPLP